MDVEEALDWAEGADGDLGYTRAAAASLAAEVRRLTALVEAVEASNVELRDVNLGLASTRELLEELLARGETAPGPDGRWLADAADQLLFNVRTAVLDYRAVEGT